MRLSRKLFVTRVDEIGANVLELPYENEQLAMILILPNPDSDVRQVQSKLDQFDVSKINEKLEQVIRLNGGTGTRSESRPWGANLFHKSAKI